VEIPIMVDENSANNILSKIPRLIFCGKRENYKIGEVKQIANNRDWYSPILTLFQVIYLTRGKKLSPSLEVVLQEKKLN
jgi:hypothetical protein